MMIHHEDGATDAEGLGAVSDSKVQVSVFTELVFHVTMHGLKLLAWKQAAICARYSCVHPVSMGAKSFRNRFGGNMQFGAGWTGHHLRDAERVAMHRHGRRADTGGEG